MSTPEEPPRHPEHQKIEDECPLDPKRFGEEVLRLCEVAKAHGIRTAIDMPGVTIVITPKDLGER